MPTYEHTSESLAEMCDRMVIVGPPGWMDRYTVTDFVVLSEVR